MFADAYSNMGNAYNDLNRLEDAIKCYNDGNTSKPTFADAYANLANAYKEGGRIDDAIICYRKALSLRPDFPDAYANLVHAYLCLCDWQGRNAQFKKLTNILTKQLESTRIVPPAIQPYHALMLSLVESNSCKLQKFALQAKMNVALLEMPPFSLSSKEVESAIAHWFCISKLWKSPHRPFDCWCFNYV